ncbi:conjugal transfer protein TrbL family protein [Sphaerisporangium sp. TRM90804]|uniref:conjugal transfer protein TrbL family protein n=1 Tax=Sphaerisporangium sp. TRM90804 TaxID=3031113 RepID=UPI00244C153A|nr:conjugal transfer protein TrbL family protein [Sphaerisporangium sp. TRM90804]MDH2426474.1 hypothetical protein [Sphaerisporangium sp. TRM90804]
MPLQIIRRPGWPRAAVAVTVATLIAVAAAVLAASAAWADPVPAPSPPPTDNPEAPSRPWLPPIPGIGLTVGGWVGSAITAWFADLVALAIHPLLAVLASTLLTTPSPAGQARVYDLWRASVLMADSAFALLIVAGGIVAMGHQTVQTRYAAKELLPRLVTAFIATNFSFVITSRLIELANAVAGALLRQGFDARRAANAIRTMIVPPGNSQIFYILLALVATMLLVLLLITFVLRLALTTLLVVAAPLALICLGLPQTEGLARLWWRAFAGTLLIQVGQSLTLTSAVRIFFNQDGREAAGLAGPGQLYDLLLALCLLIILVRIPGWVSRAVFTSRGPGSAIGRMVKYAILYKLTAPVLNAVHLGRGSRAAGSRTAATAPRASIPTLNGKMITGGPAGAITPRPATAASAARGGPGPLKHAPAAARRPIRADDWEAAPVKHAPSAPPVAGKYQPTPRPRPPISPGTPVYGYPRETRYADGPAGLAQMHRLKYQPVTPASPSQRVVAPPPVPRGPVTPIVSPNAPIPGSPEWPENPGARRTPPPTPTPRTRSRKPGGGKRT